METAPVVSWDIQVVLLLFSTYYCEILLQFYMFSILIYFKMLFTSVIVNLNFQQSLLQNLVSRDPSEIIIIEV